MNLRQWARATHRALKEQPPEDRSSLTAAQVEEVMRMSIAVLVEKLTAGEGLRVNDLGRFWLEEKPPTVVVSNLFESPKTYHIAASNVVRFKASSRLLMKMNTDDMVRAAEQNR